MLDEAGKRYDIAGAPPLERRYYERIREYARAGRPGRARALMAEWESAIPPDQRGPPGPILAAHGLIAFAEARFDSAIALFRLANDSSCERCWLQDLGHAYDLDGSPDSAIAVYERDLTSADATRIFTDYLWLASIYKRLGELYDARGDREKALSYYGKFAVLWQHADPELQPRVAQVRRRIVQLSARKG